jgi:hypothetical protein
VDDEKEAEVEVRFLPDDPTSDDRLGGRDDVAKAIARTFITEDDGKAIALTGSWGSGKSSVVKMVKNLAEVESGQKQRQVVVNFDAWCHKGDPLRCAFLVELGDRLSDEKVGWLNNEWWEGSKDGEEAGKKDEILRRKTVSRTKTTPVLSKEGRKLAFALLLFPIGLAMLSAASLNLIVGWIGLGLSIAVFVGILFLYWWASRKAKKKNERDESNGGKEKAGNNRTKAIRFFFEERETDVTTTESRTPDPTSFEFKIYFKEILEEALYDGEGNLIDDRKLMIVIDNLDRVEHSDARTIWATMQTFFEPSASGGAHDYSTRLWLLVPFDPDGVSRIWREGGYPEADGSAEPEVTDPDKKEPSAKVGMGITSSFKEKAFQITFHVSPPVLTKWKEFFETKVAWALPGHEADYHSLYRLYDLRLTSQAGVTPRGIILYINRIAALHLQWGDDIPIVVQGLYALKSEIEVDGQNEEDKIRNLIENLPPRFISVIDENEHPGWRNQLAALHYNVAPELALQMVYKPTIRKYLREGNVDELAQIATVQGVPDFLEGCIEEDIPTYDTKGFATAASVLRCLDDTKSASVEPMWQKLAQGFIKYAPPVVDLDAALGAEISEIVAHASALVIQDLLQVVAERISLVNVSWAEENADVIFQNWLEGTLRIIEGFHTIAPGGDWRASFYVPSENHYMGMMTKLIGDGKPDEILRYFVPCPGKEGAILTRLQDVVSSGQYSEIYDKAVKKMVPFGAWPWETLARALSARLSDSEADLQQGEIGACIRSLVFLGYEVGDSTAQAELATMSAGGQLQHRLSVIQSSDDFEAIALVVFPILITNPSGDIEAPFRESQAGIDYYHSLADNPVDNQKVIDEIAALILKHKKVEYLVESMLHTREEGLAAVIINTASVRDDAHGLLPSEFLLQHFDEISGIVIDENFSKLVETLIEHGDLINKIYEGGFRDGHVALYSKVLQVEGVFAEKKDDTESKEASARLDIPSFNEFLVLNLGQVIKETWLEELRGGGQLINLLLQLAKNKIVPNLGINFGQALTENIQETIKADVPSIQPVVVDNVDLLLAAMDPNVRQSFLIDLCNFAATEQGTAAPILRAFGTHLYSDSLVELTEKNYKPLFLNILSRTDVDEVSWIVEALNSSQKLLEKASGEMRVPLLDGMKKKLDEPELPDDYRNRVFEIGDLLGESLRPPPEVTAEESPGTELNRPDFPGGSII